MRLENLILPMSSPFVRAPTFNSSLSQFLIAAFQVTLWNLRIWLLRLSSDCDLVTPLPSTVELESGDLDYSGRVFSTPLELIQIQRSGC